MKTNKLINKRKEKLIAQSTFFPCPSIISIAGRYTLQYELPSSTCEHNTKYIPDYYSSTLSEKNLANIGTLTLKLRHRPC